MCAKASARACGSHAARVAPAGVQLRPGRRAPSASISASRNLSSPYSGRCAVACSSRRAPAAAEDRIDDPDNRDQEHQQLRGDRRSQNGRLRCSQGAHCEILECGFRQREIAWLGRGNCPARLKMPAAPCVSAVASEQQYWIAGCRSFAPASSPCCIQLYVPLEAGHWQGRPRRAAGNQFC